MKKKRKPPAVTKHLWEVEIRHRDWSATMNSNTKTLYMKHTNLWIVSPQPPAQRPDIDLAMAKARRFLNRHQREYGLPGIVRVQNRGYVDN